jgi:hypothetical protein
MGGSGRKYMLQWRVLLVGLLVAVAAFGGILKGVGSSLGWSW